MNICDINSRDNNADNLNDKKKGRNVKKIADVNDCTYKVFDWIGCIRFFFLNRLQNC